MSKKNCLAPEVVQNIIADYRLAFRFVHGENRLRDLHISYKKGWFYLGLDGRPPSPYSRKEIVEMTLALGNRVPQRKDSDSDGEPD